MADPGELTADRTGRGTMIAMPWRWAVFGGAVVGGVFWGLVAAMTIGAAADDALHAAQDGHRPSLAPRPLGQPEQSKVLEPLALHTYGRPRLLSATWTAPSAGPPGTPAAPSWIQSTLEESVPSTNLLGEAGRGLQYLMSHLPRGRLGVTAKAMATTRAIFDMTVLYCQERSAFGSPLTDKQHVRFELAEMATEIDIAQAYTDRSVLAYNTGELTAVDAAKGKWYLSELQKRIIDRCLQLHGGYGYMIEYPVARAYLDTRVQTIYGGTTEIMKEIIGRDIAAS